MGRKGLWAQMHEPATTKDWFLVCLNMGIGIIIGTMFGAASVSMACH